MTEIRFYHLTKSSSDDAMPPLLEKALKAYKRIIVKCIDKAQVAQADKVLWGGRPDSFLPHGTEDMPHKEIQPILITSNDNNDNDAEMLLVLGGAELPVDKIETFKLICLMFDGTDGAQVQAARQLWKNLKEKEALKLTYYQQEASGGWKEKAGT